MVLASSRALGETISGAEIAVPESPARGTVLFVTLFLRQAMLQTKLLFNCNARKEAPARDVVFNLFFRFNSVDENDHSHQSPTP